MAVNLDACIHCNLCVRACREVQVNDVIGMAWRGHGSKVVFDFDDPMGVSTCVACGECVQACPAGALMPKSIVDEATQVGSRAADRQVRSVCPYCGVGCQITYKIRGDRIAWVEGAEGPANQNRLCVKGRFGFDYVDNPQRLTKPLIRKPGVEKGLNVDPRNPLTHFREASWEEALIPTGHGPAPAARPEQRAGRLRRRTHSDGLPGLHEGCRRDVAGTVVRHLGERAQSDPDANHARHALASLEHLVVQDIFLTETAMFADVVLPATAWPEKTGTVSNTNRQVQLGRKAIEPPGDAREDWWITVQIARRLGLDWPYEHPSEIFAEMKRGMRSLDNITWERLENENVVQYPCSSDDHPGYSIVFSDRFPTESGRAKLVPAKMLPPAERPDTDYPFVLTTGRQLEHWHTGAMTRRASKLDAIEPTPSASMHPMALRRLGAAPGDTLRIETRRGAIQLAARSDEAMQEDMVFVPFAYVEASANELTNPQLDPVGKIPEFKYCAARIERVGAR